MRNGIKLKRSKANCKMGQSDPFINFVSELHFILL